MIFCHFIAAIGHSLTINSLSKFLVLVECYTNLKNRNMSGVYLKMTLKLSHTVIVTTTTTTATAKLNAAYAQKSSSKQDVLAHNWRL